jgi:glycine oxidase
MTAPASGPLPHLIVGQGLAGTAVAWRFWERGLPFQIVDSGQAVTSSKIAAGLITPITGKKLNLSWRFSPLYQEALEFYRRLEMTLGLDFYHETPQVRLLRDERESNLWAKRRQQPDILPWLDPESPGPLVDESAFRAERGGFQQHSSGWLDTGTYLEASRAFFQRLGCYEEAVVREEDLESDADAVHWRDGKFSTVVLCRGWQQHQSRFFPWLTFNSARGVIATIRCAMDESRIISNGPWLLPRGKDLWRAGSTYEFDFDLSLENSLADLSLKLKGLLRAPFEIQDAQAAIRPIIKHHPLVVLGRHPRRERIALFNGLGSKGALRAPGFAKALVEHLLDGAPLDEEVDVRTNE